MRLETPQIEEINTIPMLYAFGLAQQKEEQEVGIDADEVVHIFEAIRTRPTMLDVPYIMIRDENEIKNLLDSYNIDLETPTDALRLLDTMKRAIDFLSLKVLPITSVKSKDSSESVTMMYDDHRTSPEITDLYREINRTQSVLESAINAMKREYGNNADIINSADSVRESYNPKEIQKMFSYLLQCVNTDSNIDKDLKRQACAVLRIMRAIEYNDTNPSSKYFKTAKKQLSEKVASHMDGLPPEFDPEKVFEEDQSSSKSLFGIRLVKNSMRLKEEDSRIMKMLHSEKYGETPPMDFVGIRMVTETREDALRLFYELFFGPNAIMHFTRIHSGQTKNLLFDPNKLRDLLKDPEKAKAFFNREDSEHDFTFSNDPNVTDVTQGGNLLSSNDYRALHVVFDLPVRTRYCTIRSISVELQIMDRRSDLRNEDTHIPYKKKQQLKLYRRLMGQEPPCAENPVE